MKKGYVSEPSLTACIVGLFWKRAQLLWTSGLMNAKVVGRSKERREDGLGVNEPKVVMGQQCKADFCVIIVIFVYHDT